MEAVQGRIPVCAGNRHPSHLCAAVPANPPSTTTWEDKHSHPTCEEPGGSNLLALPPNVATTTVKDISCLPDTPHCPTDTGIKPC